jgi:DNA-binding transcriptional MerR regulator
MASATQTTKSAQALKTISEVAEILDLPQHVLRFWETRFPQIQPLKRRGGRRFYRPEDVAALEMIRTLLHEKGYTIKGAQALLSKGGGRLKLVKDEIPAASSGSAPGATRRARVQAVRDELVELREVLRKAG